MLHVGRGAHVAGRFGKPPGRLVSAPVNVYAAFAASVLGAPMVWLSTRAAKSYLLSTFLMGITWTPAAQSMPVKADHTPLTRPIGAAMPGYNEESDPGAASSCNASGYLPGRRRWRAHFVWLPGKRTSAWPPTSRQGERAGPSTLMYGNWPIQHDASVRGANCPLTAELRAQHRLYYAGYKTNHKCTR